MVYIITAIHNRKQATLEFLDSLFKQTYTRFKIIIVDDGSTDGSSQAIATKYKHVTLIKGDGTLWWTGSLNRIFQQLIPKLKSKDFVLTMNADSVVDPNYLNLLLDISNQHDRAIVGSISRDYTSRKIDRVGVTIDWKRFVLHHIPYNPQQAIIANADTLSTRGTLIPQEVIKKVGLFDEKNFPHYVSDYDYFLRAKKAGFTLLISTRAIVYNRTDLTGFRPTQKYLSPKQIYSKLTSIKSPGNVSNTVRFNWIHSPSLPLKIWTVIRYFVWLIKWITENIIGYTAHRYKKR